MKHIYNAKTVGENRTLIEEERRERVVSHPIIALNSSGLKKYSYRHVFATAMHYLVKQVARIYHSEHRWLRFFKRSHRRITV